MSLDSNKSVDFWEELKTFLKSYYGDSDSSKIIEKFQNLHKSYVESLSLDDIERLSIAIKEKM
jgi:hypothetical protein